MTTVAHKPDRDLARAGLFVYATGRSSRVTGSVDRIR